MASQLIVTPLSGENRNGGLLGATYLGLCATLTMHRMNQGIIKPSTLAKREVDDTFFLRGKDGLTLMQIASLDPFVCFEVGYREDFATLRAKLAVNEIFLRPPYDEEKKLSESWENLTKSKFDWRFEAMRQTLNRESGNVAYMRDDRLLEAV